MELTSQGLVIPSSVAGRGRSSSTDQEAPVGVDLPSSSVGGGRFTSTDLEVHVGACITQMEDSTYDGFVVHIAALDMRCSNGFEALGNFSSHQ